MIITSPGGAIVQPITGNTIYNPAKVKCRSGMIYDTQTASCISATQWPPHTTVASPPTGTLIASSSLMQFLSDNWMLVAFGIIAIIVIAFFILRR